MTRYHISWVIFLSFNWKTEDEMNQWMWKRVWLKIIVIYKETNEIVLMVLSSSYFLTMIQIYGLNLILVLKTLNQWNELYRRCDRKLWWCWLVCVAGYKRLGTGRSHWTCRKCNSQVDKKINHHWRPILNFTFRKCWIIHEKWTKHTFISGDLHLRGCLEEWQLHPP